MTFIFPRSHLAGLTLSTAGGSSSFGVAAGQCTDSTNAAIVNLASAMTKTTAAWAAGSGNGALDTGSIAVSTWYHIHLISDAVGQTVDILVSLSATAPTMPAGYTLSRRIGSMKTNGSSQWTSFTQVGDEFHWAANVLDLTLTQIPATTAQTATLTVPPGVQVNALFHFVAQASVSGNIAILITSLDENDVVPNTLGTANCNLFGDQGLFFAVDLNKRTNTSAQIRWRSSGSASGAQTGITTFGWIDRRGKDA